MGADNDNSKVLRGWERAWTERPGTSPWERVISVGCIRLKPRVELHEDGWRVWLGTGGASKERFPTAKDAMTWAELQLFDLCQRAQFEITKFRQEG